MGVYTGPTVKPVHADMNKVPPGDDGKPATVVMTLPNGKQVWLRTLIRAKRLPRLDPATGDQQWKLHPTTAQPMWPLWNNVRAEREQMFTMESDGHNNIYVQDYVPPSPEEVQRVEAERRAAKFRDDLARLAVENGVSAEELFAKLMEARGSASMDSGSDDAAEFPKFVSPGRWGLSDGSVFKGKKAEAQEANAALQAVEGF